MCEPLAGWFSYQPGEFQALLSWPIVRGRRCALRRLEFGHVGATAAYAWLAYGAGSADDESFAAEVSDDLHASAECRDVGSKGSQLARVDLGTFDG